MLVGLFLLLMITALPSFNLQAQEATLLDRFFWDRNFRLFDEPIDPDLYLIRPGDSLAVVFANIKISPMRLIVTSSGNIAHQTLGIIDLSSLTLTEARQKLTKILSQKFNADQIDIAVAAPVRVAITVGGAVNKPGVYFGYTSQRVSEMIKKAGGISGRGSTRRIQFSGGPQTLMVDLKRAVQLGETDADPFLYAGHAIFVPAKSDRVIHVVGAVVRPTELEFLPEDNLGLLLKLAGGLIQSESRSVVKIRRGQDVLDPNQTDLVPDDVIFVERNLNDPAEQIVSIYGSLSNPGRYEFREGMTVTDLINTAGGMTDDASAGLTTVFRLVEFSDRRRSGEYRYPVANLVTDRNAIVSYPLHRRDSVFVPPVVGFVEVSGEIANAGLYPFTFGKNAEFYVNAAGGFLPTAETKILRLFNRVSGVTSPATTGMIVHDGDQLIVTLREELK